MDIRSKCDVTARETLCVTSMMNEPTNGLGLDVE